MHQNLFVFACSLIFLNRTLANPACSEQQWNKCTEPVDRYFLMQYPGYPRVVSDELWAVEMSTQCQINRMSDLCQMSLAKRCPQSPHVLESRWATETTAPPSCEADVKFVLAGCAPDFSAWYRKCVETFLAVTTTADVDFESSDSLCQEADRLERCMTDNARGSCNNVAQTIIQRWANQQKADYGCTNSGLNLAELRL